jgi:hypothetical protein
MEAYARKATGAGAERRPIDTTRRPPPPPLLPREVEPAKRSQPLSTRVVPRPAPSLTPNSIEGALLGAIDGSSPPVITERAIDDPVEVMRQLLSAADYAGALVLADLILTDDPGNADARECQQKCQAELDRGVA